MKLTIDLPEPVCRTAENLASEHHIELHDWISGLLVEVITSNEIHYMRNEPIDWREELLS